MALILNLVQGAVALVTAVGIIFWEWPVWIVVTSFQINVSLSFISMIGRMESPKGQMREAIEAVSLNLLSFVLICITAKEVGGLFYLVPTPKWICAVSIVEVLMNYGPELDFASGWLSKLFVFAGGTTMEKITQGHQ